MRWGVLQIARAIREAYDRGGLFEPFLEEYSNFFRQPSLFAALFALLASFFCL